MRLECRLWTGDSVARLSSLSVPPSSFANGTRSEAVSSLSLAIFSFLTILYCYLRFRDGTNNP